MSNTKTHRAIEDLKAEVARLEETKADLIDEQADLLTEKGQPTPPEQAN